MNSSQRIIFNTAGAYACAILSAGLALLTSRCVLRSIGETDYGLFSVVGALIIFVTILNTIMAASAARHFSFAIGRGDPGEVNRWFNAALAIHLCLAVGLVLVSWPVGEYLIAAVLAIPPERVTACRWVFRVSLVSAFFSMVSMPFVAMFTARQRMVEPPLWNVAQYLLVLLLASQLGTVPGDRLIFYAAGTVAIMVGIRLAQTIRALAVFNDCRIRMRYWRDRARIRDVFAFAGWTMVGTMGATIRDQGAAILLNLRFGPNINAAYGIASQVSGTAGMLANAMIGAFAPEMTACEGRGDRVRMLALAQRASKFGTLFMMFFAVPLIAEMDYILDLWLTAPPRYAGGLCQLIMIALLFDRLTAGNMLAVNAHGRIAAYHATLGTCVVLTLPLAWLFLKQGAPPTGVGAAFIITAVVLTLGRVIWMRRLLGVPIWRWLAGVLAPCGLVAMVGAAIITIFVRLMAPSFARLAVGGGACVLAMVLMSWWAALDGRERTFIQLNVRKLWSKTARIFTGYAGHD